MIKICENFSLGSSLNQSRTYQGNPCGVYLDLSSFTGCGVIQISEPVSSDLLLGRITSSGIRASTLDTGSIFVLIDCQFHLFLFIVQVRLSSGFFVFHSFWSSVIVFFFVLYSVCACRIVFFLLYITFVSAYSNSVWVKTTNSCFSLWNTCYLHPTCKQAFL